MKIAVCVKQVPDTWSEKTLTSDLRTDRDHVDAVVNELDEYAIEASLTLAEQHNGHVTAITMGPDAAADAVRKALAMGADAGLHICDDALEGADSYTTADVLSRVITAHEYDLVVFGSESTDARMGVIPAMVAELTGYHQLTRADTVTLTGSTVTITTHTDTHTAELSAALPAVISVVEKANEPRYPSFKGIMAAKKKPLDRVTLADLHILEDGIRTLAVVTSYTPTSTDRAGIITAQSPTSAKELADWLTSNNLI